MGEITKVKKNLPKIVYERLSTHEDYLELNPLPGIYWDVAPAKVPNPVIVISHIGGSSMENGVRIDMYQFSVWADSKSEVLKIADVVVEIFNRWKSADVEYCHLDHNREVYDGKAKCYGEHLAFDFKVFDCAY